MPLVGKGNTVYSVNGRGRVTAFDMSGAELWTSDSIKAGSLMSGPAIFRDRILVACSQALCCLSTKDGSLLWRAPNQSGEDLNLTELQRELEHDFGLGIQGCTQQDEVAVVSRLQYCRFLDLATGKLVRSARLGMDICGQYAIDTTDHENRLSLILHDIETLDEFAHTVPLPEDTYANVVGTSGVLCFSGADRTVCIESASGKVIWSVDQTELVLSSGLRLAIDDVSLYVKSEVVQCHDLRTGQLRWRLRHAEHGVYDSKYGLVVSPSYVYTRPTWYQLEAVDKEKGEPVGQMELPKDARYSSLRIIGNRLFVTDENWIYCFMGTE